MTRPMPGPPDPMPHEDSARPHDSAAAPWNYCSGCAAENRLRLADPKRLTDAECAAEYWRARADFWANESLCLGGWFGWADGAEEVEDPPLYDVDRWYDVTHRFATRPHALEEA